MFISGAPTARMTHVIVGAVLSFLAIVPVVSAWRLASHDGVPRHVAVGSTMLEVGRWAQKVLGHTPFPVITVIHVPLGVALFGLSVCLVAVIEIAGRMT